MTHTTKISFLDYFWWKADVITVHYAFVLLHNDFHYKSLFSIIGLVFFHSMSVFPTDEGIPWMRLDFGEISPIKHALH